MWLTQIDGSMAVVNDIASSASKNGRFGHECFLI